MKKSIQKDKAHDRVLHILTRLVKGGADENTVFTIEGLIRHGYDVDLVVGGDSDPSLISELGGLNVIVIPELRREVKPSNLAALWKLYRLITKNRYYFVHTHTAMAGFLGRVASKLARTPIVIHSLHGTTFHDHMSYARKQLYIYLEVLASRCTDYYITVGDDIKERYLEAAIGNREQYATIRSGFDYRKFEQARLGTSELKRAFRDQFGLSERDVLIGMVSRIEPRKGHVYLLDAAQAVIRKQPNCKFVIVGEGYFKDAFISMVEEAGCAEHFIFTGHREDIERVMAAFDICVLTSLWEGLPRVLVQAVLLAKPIVTFDVEGAKEVVKESYNGYIIAPKNSELLAEKLLQLSQDLRRAEEMGRNGLNLVSDRWDKEVMVEETVNVYRTLKYRKDNNGAVTVA